MTHIKHTLINKKHVECSYFDHLIHISDIHVRPLERHNEYTLVFQRLNDYVKKQSKKKNLAVAITGDVFDNKTVFKPETFMLSKSSSKTLQQTAPCSLSTATTICSNPTLSAWMHLHLQ